jgi:hypothetical protein
MKYFDGKPPDTLRFGTPWPEGNFTWITKTTEVAPGFYGLSERSGLIHIDRGAPDVSEKLTVWNDREVEETSASFEARSAPRLYPTYAVVRTCLRA